MVDLLYQNYFDNFMYECVTKEEFCHKIYRNKLLPLPLRLKKDQSYFFSLLYEYRNLFSSANAAIGKQKCAEQSEERVTHSYDTIH